MPTALHPADADRPIIHPAYVAMLCGLLVQEGGDVDLVLARAGVERRALDPGGPMLPLSAMRWLVHAAVRAAGRPTLALESGARIAPATHGRLGDALRCSANLRQALQALARAMPLRTGALRLHLEAEPGGWVCRIEPRLALGDIERFLIEHFAASLSRLCREISGTALDGASFDLPWPRPPWHALEARLCAPPRHDAPAAALHLPDALLDRPNPSADAVRCAAALRDCEAEAAQPQGVVPHVRRMLATGALEHWTLAAVAARLGTSERTVMRRLKAEGLDFRALLDELRGARALGWVRDTKRPMAEIARELGYRSATNFSRSFRRWHGVAPELLRRPPSDSSFPDSATEAD
jgi:AraC-like DNA-binding protein